MFEPPTKGGSGLRSYIGVADVKADWLAGAGATKYASALD
jgi:hypothetical protein